MGKVQMTGSGGGGVSSDECTASKAQVLAGYTAVTSDSEDEAVTGTMPINGDQSATLKCGESKQIPEGYTSGGTVKAADLASQTKGTATEAYIYKGKTAVVNGATITGNMTCSSILSFSVAAYSTSQVLATWINPAKGPFSGVIICAKIGGYPTNKDDSRVYTGVGNNSAANGTSSVTIGGLTAGTTYYFRIWAYVTCSAGNFYSGYLQATAMPTAHGRQVFTSSGTFIVPTAVRGINIHCTGGGGGGGGSRIRAYGGGGGGGGYTSYINGISVTPGANIPVVVGAGGAGGSGGGKKGTTGGISSVTVNGITCSAAGGMGGGGTNDGAGGSGGGGYAYGNKSGSPNGGAGGSNGGDGAPATGEGGKGQGTTTREFGSGTLYSGGGGGGIYIYYGASVGAGGSGGGGAGGSNGSFGTGGGGGGGCTDYSAANAGLSGGSGNVIITW